MTKRGKTPSLIGGAAGKPKFVIAKKKRKCKRCKTEVCQGIKCVEIPIPGSMGSKTYCMDCFSEIISKSRQDLDQLEQLV